MYTKTLLSIIMSCLAFAIQAGNTNTLKTFGVENDGDPPKVHHLNIGHWSNAMDSNGCVILDEGNKLEVKAMITLAINDLSQVLPIYIHAEMQGVVTYNAVIDQNLLEPLTMPSGAIVYTYSQVVYYNSFDDHCETNPEVPISFDYNIRLTDSTGVLYPIEKYPELYTIVTSGNEDSDEAILPTLIYSGTKNLCCYGNENDPTAFVEQMDHSIETEASPRGSTVHQNGTETIDLSVITPYVTNTIQKPLVYPNPFHSELNIKVYGASDEALTIQLWDINGRLVHYTKYLQANKGIEETQINTSQLNPGFYYCIVKSSEQLHTFKVLKTQ